MVLLCLAGCYHSAWNVFRVRQLGQFVAGDKRFVHRSLLLHGIAQIADDTV